MLPFRRQTEAQNFVQATFSRQWALSHFPLRLHRESGGRESAMSRMWSFSVCSVELMHLKLLSIIPGLQKFTLHGKRFMA